MSEIWQAFKDLTVMRLYLSKKLPFAAKNIAFDIHRKRSIHVFDGCEEGESKPEPIDTFMLVVLA